MSATQSKIFSFQPTDWSIILPCWLHFATAGHLVELPSLFIKIMIFINSSTLCLPRSTVHSLNLDIITIFFSGEATGEIWNWSLLGVKGLIMSDFTDHILIMQKIYQPLPFLYQPHINHLYRPHTTPYDHVPTTYWQINFSLLQLYIYHYLPQWENVSSCFPCGASTFFAVTCFSAFVEFAFLSPWVSLVASLGSSFFTSLSTFSGPRIMSSFVDSDLTQQHGRLL